MTTLPVLFMTSRMTTAPVRDPQVDNKEPPGKPPKLPKYGSYCFRAYTDIVSEKSEVLKEFTGFDDNLSIVDTVNRYCELHKEGKEVCNPPKLSFIGGASDMCDGRVIAYDNQTGVTQIYTTKPFYD